ncbi:uncharacterized protein LOC135096373 isoform X2 [Scylla paramamosain]|uniref:uncharacterized protein LOC135096373 isoform X2 n=1 Tax=Scylla paramamosain TaxID=85552 RepID=UPI003082B475
MQIINSYWNPTPDESLGFIWRPATADELQHLSLTPTPAMKGDTRREIIVRHSKDQWLHPSQISHYIKIRKYIDSWQSMKKTGIWKSAWNFVVEVYGINTSQQATKYTPFFLMHVRAAKAPHPLNTSQESLVGQTIDSKSAAAEYLIEDAIEFRKKKKKKNVSNEMIFVSLTLT